MFRTFSGQAVLLTVCMGFASGGLGMALAQEPEAQKEVAQARTPDPRVAELEALRKSLATVKVDKLDGEMAGYFVALTQNAKAMIRELKADDAIAALEAAVPLSKKAKGASAGEVAGLLARAKAVKAGLIRIAPALKVLESNPKDKEAARTAVECYVLDLDRTDLALSVAQEAQWEELSTLLFTGNSGTSTGKDELKRGEWMLDIGKRVPAVASLAKSKANEAYQRALAVTGEGALTEAEKEQVKALIAGGAPSEDGWTAMSGLEILKRKPGEPLPVDPRLAVLDSQRRGLALVKKEKQKAEQASYFSALVKSAREMIQELRHDDAITVLQPSVVMAKTSMASDAEFVEPLLAKARAGRTALIRVSLLMRQLEKDPGNKDVARQAVEAIVIELERRDLAATVARDAGASELEAMIFRLIAGTGGVRECVAEGDWMMEAGKRTASLKRAAQVKAYEAYTRGLSLSQEGAEGLTEAEKKRVFGVVRELLAPPAGPAETNAAGYRRADVSPAGVSEVDQFLASLDLVLTPMNGRWLPSQIRMVESMVNQAFPLKRKMTVGGRVKRITFEPNGNNPPIFFMAYLKVENRFGLDIEWIVWFPQPSQELQGLQEGDMVTAHGELYKCVTGMDGIKFRLLEAKLVQLRPVGK